MLVGELVLELDSILPFLLLWQISCVFQHFQNLTVIPLLQFLSHQFQPS